MCHQEEETLLNASVHRPLIGIPSASFEPPSTPGWPLYRYNGSYTTALASAGGAPVAIPLGLGEETLRAIFGKLEGLCLAGGDDVDPEIYAEQPHPALRRIDAERDATELLLTRWALAADLPVLGICRGIQLLNVAAGGNLYQDLAAQCPGALQHSYALTESPWERPTQRVRVAEASRLATILGTCELPINSFHHQAVKAIAPDFVAVAWTEDGVIEGIEAPDRKFAIGVQRHPEGMYGLDAIARRLFAAFIAECRST
jgi:putative glutamine amidotransferase